MQRNHYLCGLFGLGLILTGCAENALSYDEQYERDEDRHARLNPPGRYQMMPVPDEEAVFVLDTGDGSIRLCGPLRSEARNGYTPMGCGPAATQ